MYKSISWGLSIPELSKTVMYEFWYGEKVRLCYMDTDSFMV